MRQFAGRHIMELMSDQPLHVVCQSPPAANHQRYKLTLLLSGRCRCRHAGRETYWEAGDLILFDGAQSFDVAHPADFHLVTCNLPQEAICSMLAEPDNSAGVRIPGSHGVGTILSNFARSLVAESAHCSEATQRHLIMHLTSLIGLALGGSELARHSRREAQRAALRQQIFTYIETHLRNSGLSPRRAAHDLRISVRSLHLLLEDCEMSFARWVTQRRLEECTRMLNDPAYDRLSIADVAFRCGFNDLSTFNRCFRANYAMTPSDARRRKPP
jgi:AraC-like DNA-binding protein